MSTDEESDVDSDLEDPDLEGLELLRKALGTHYTAEGHDADFEDDTDDDAGVDPQQRCRTDVDQLELQGEGADDPNARADLTGSPQGSPDGMPSAIQHQAMLQNGSQAHTASGEAVDDDEGEDAADEDEEDDEEWEPAPTRTELLRNAVQYLQQASAGQGPPHEAQLQQDEAIAQEETTVSRAERALAANRRLQDRLRGILEAIDGALWSNAQMQAKLMHNTWLHPRAGRYRGMRVVSNATWGEADASAVGPSQFWVAGRQVPEPNADTLRVAPVFQYLPQQFKDPSWLPEEATCLTDALLKAAQRAHRAETAATLASGSRNGQIPPPDKDNCDSQPALTLQAEGVESIIDDFDSAAWEEIARIGPAGRTAEECWKQWTHQLRPSLNKADWTAEEDASLLAHINRLGTHAWDEVAEGLGTGRTPAACLAQYQRRQKRDALLNSKWTPEEATRLANVIAKLGTRDWQAVAVEMGGRTPGQVQHFYQDNLSNCYKKGAWDHEEDEALKQAVKACGKHWREVAKRVPARTDKQCRERYANVLDPELKLYTEWTPGEDALLLRAINEHTQPDGKIKWSAVSRMIPGRTDHVCVRHYKMLMKAGPPRQKHARAVRQRSGRFVAWEKVDAPELLTASPGAEALQIEDAPLSAPAETGRKARGARKAKRAKHKAGASSSAEEQELDLEGMTEYAYGSEGDCEQDNFVQTAEAVDGRASAKTTKLDHEPRVSKPPKSRSIRKPKAKGSKRKHAHTQKQGANNSKGSEHVVPPGRSSRKRRAG